jgi:hypothetical protein
MWRVVGLNERRLLSDDHPVLHSDVLRVVLDIETVDVESGSLRNVLKQSEVSLNNIEGLNLISASRSLDDEVPAHSGEEPLSEDVHTFLVGGVMIPCLDTAKMLRDSGSHYHEEVSHLINLGDGLEEPIPTLHAVWAFTSKLLDVENHLGGDHGGVELSVVEVGTSLPCHYVEYLHDYQLFLLRSHAG